MTGQSATLWKIFGAVVVPVPEAVGRVWREFHLKAKVKSAGEQQAHWPGVAVNPAHSVHGPKHVVKRGKTC
jgi:hypothetical protein